MSRVRAPNDGAAARHDSRLPRGVNAATGIIIFRTYQQHPDDEWTKPALDLIGLLCLEGVAEAGAELDRFER